MYLIRTFYVENGRVSFLLTGTVPVLHKRGLSGVICLKGENY